MKALINARAIGLVIFYVISFSVQSAEIECGDPFNNHFGPFDYRTAARDTLQLVEGRHFAPSVEQLVSGVTASKPSQDLGYTLNVFPNHHRALMTLIRYAKKTKSEHPDGMKISVACRFERAERFAPNDPMVKALFGLYLMQNHRNEEAIKKFYEALDLAGDNANVYYNLGLAYFDLRDYDKALASAHKAYQLGFQLPGLRQKLEKIGKWKDLPSPAVSQPELPSSRASDGSPGQ